MAYEMKDGQGSLFENEAKQDPQNQKNLPDMRGRIKIAGQEYWISGWWKDGRNGQWMSLSIQEKQQRRGERIAQDAQREFGRNDEPPF